MRHVRVRLSNAFQSYMGNDLRIRATLSPSPFYLSPNIDLRDNILREVYICELREVDRQIDRLTPSSPGHSP